MPLDTLESQRFRICLGSGLSSSSGNCLIVVSVGGVQNRPRSGRDSTAGEGDTLVDGGIRPDVYRWSNIGSANSQRTAEMTGTSVMPALDNEPLGVTLINLDGAGTGLFSIAVPIPQRVPGTSRWTVGKDIEPSLCTKPGMERSVIPVEIVCLR